MRFQTFIFILKLYIIIIYSIYIAHYLIKNYSKRLKYRLTTIRKILLSKIKRQIKVHLYIKSHI